MTTRAPNAAVYSVANRAVYYRWDGLLNADDGGPVELQDFLLGSLQILGTIGAGFNLNFQGSNELIAVNWVNIALLSTQTALGLVIPNIAINVRNVRPIVTAGDGTTNVSVLLVGMRRA